MLGPLAHLLGVGVPDSIAAAVLEAKGSQEEEAGDSREGAAMAFQEGVGEAEDEIDPLYRKIIPQHVCASFNVSKYNYRPIALPTYFSFPFYLLPPSE